MLLIKIILLDDGAIGDDVGDDSGICDDGGRVGFYCVDCVK